MRTDFEYYWFKAGLNYRVFRKNCIFHNSLQPISTEEGANFWKKKQTHSS